MNENSPETPWHSLKKAEVVDALESSEEGLSDEEAKIRLEEFGPNHIGEEIEIKVWKVALKQFQSPLIYVLLISMLITTWLERWDDTIIIGIILLINAVIGFFQEYKAENSIQALMNIVSPRAKVKRDGRFVERPVSEIVPGDIIKLQEGSIVSADGRIIKNHSIHLSESALTGESIPVHKTSQPIEDDVLGPSDMENMVFMGTSVTSGEAEALVVGTGGNTEIGKIAEEVRKAAHTGTPLQERMSRMAKGIVVVLFFIILTCFGIGVLSGRSVAEMFLLSISLAVGAIPEGLPIVMSIALAIGVKRMGKNGAIVRKLPAVETLGSTTVILSDKTGTITQNKMRVTEILSGGKLYQNFGNASELEGKNQALHLTLLGGALNNNAHENDNEWSGDPMEVAMKKVAQKNLSGLQEAQSLHERIDAVPFKTEERYSATVHTDSNQQDGKVIFVKGAPERVLEMCDFVMTPTGEKEPIDREEIHQWINQMAEDGLRVLAFAVGYGNDAADKLKRQGPGRLIFTGAQGLLDPPRDEAIDAIKKCHSAGIRVMMVTGDHKKTAAAVAKKIKLIKKGSVSEAVTGSELRKMDDRQLREVLKRRNVFARVEPQQKLRLVDFLKNEGEIIAVTGDGVNDAPALKSAHLGVAMGKTGTDVAKEASDMVITDDNFASIFEAVKAGRTAFRNIRMATYFLLSCGAAEVIIILSSLILFLPLPLLPAQILWINVVTNGIQDVALAFEPGNEELYSRPPRSPNEGIMDWPLIERTILIGIWFTICTLSIYVWKLYQQGVSLEEAQTTAVTSLVFLMIFQVFNCRRENESIFTTPLTSNKWILFSLVALVIHVSSLYWTVTQELLSFTPLSLKTWLVIMPLGATSLFINEIHKWLCRERGYGLFKGKLFLKIFQKISGAEKKEISADLERIEAKIDQILSLEEERKNH